MARSARDKQVQRARNLILGFLGLAIAIVVGFGLFYSTGLSQSGHIVEGKQYRVLGNAPPDDPRKPIIVREFFSYGCIHCKNFEPLLEDWVHSLPSDVVFKRNPVGFHRPLWEMMAQAYLTLAALNAVDENHERIFEAIHDHQKQFLTPEMMADFVAGHGVTRQQFLDTFNSPAIRREAYEANQRTDDFQISGTPSLVVNDRYVITGSVDVSRKDMLDIADALIERIRQQRKKTS